MLLALQFSTSAYFIVVRLKPHPFRRFQCIKLPVIPGARAEGSTKIDQRTDSCVQITELTVRRTSFLL